LLPRIRWGRVLSLSKGSLRTKIIAWSFVPTAIILVAVALVTFYTYQRVTESLVIKRDRELTRLSASLLAAELKAYTDPFTDQFPAVFDGGVVLFNTYGALMPAEPDLPEGWEPGWLEAISFREILGSSEPVFSDIMSDGPRGEKVVVVVVPIPGRDGESVGGIAGLFRLGPGIDSALYSSVDKLRREESNRIYLVDGNGIAIYHSNPDRIGEDLSTQAVVGRVLNGEMGALRTRDVDGQDIVASFAPVPGTSWGLVTEESWVALTAFSRRYGQFLLLLLVLGVAVPILVAGVGVRRITRPIVELISAAQGVARGNFGQTITARTGDEVEELAKQFNLMSAQLRESYAHLEQRVADRTTELAALNAIAAVVSQSLDLEDILNDALDKTLQVMEVEAGGIYLLDEEAGVMTVAVQRGFSPQFVAGVDRLKVGEGFSGRVAQSGQPLVVSDVSADPRLTRMVAREEGFRSMAIVPLSSKGKVLGTLFASTRGYREFTGQDVQLLTSIGHQIGVAIENARFFEAEQRRAEQFRVISEVGRRITSILDIDEVLVQVVRLVHQAFDYDHVSIALIEGDEAVYKVGAGDLWDDPQFQFRPSRLKVGQEGITGWVAAMGEPLLVPDVSQEPRYVWMQGSHTRSELTVPIKVKGAVVGVLDVQSDRLAGFDDSDLVMLQSLANQAAIAIENARLYEQAQRLAVLEERNRLARDLHDAVTQTLFSAGLVAEALPISWESSQQEGRQLLKELRQLTRGALAEMRTLLLELRPTALVESSLEGLLHQLAEAATGREGVPVTVTVEGKSVLPSDVHVALYRIAQEALNNVVKHARASQVAVRLRCTSSASTGTDGEGRETVELSVSDDGRGFDPRDVPSDRLGLGIMRERAQAIGATLTIESQPGGGTRIRVVWGKGEGRGTNDE